jgi:hypothetical protein
MAGVGVCGLIMTMAAGKGAVKTETALMAEAATSGGSLDCTFRFLFRFVEVPEPWTGFLFRPESSGIPPEHP